MRKLAIAAALASTAMATPAVARDHSFYAGLEGGAMWIEDVDFSYTDSNGLNLDPAFTLRHNTGVDVDVIWESATDLVELAPERLEFVTHLPALPARRQRRYMAAKGHSPVYERPGLREPSVTVPPPRWRVG